jgi:Tfp pilus assembly protein PilN
MIAMLRINLLPSKEVKKKKGGRQVIFLMAALLVAEVAGMYLWYSSIDTATKVEAQRVKDMEQKVQDLNKIKDKIAEREAAKDTLMKQNYVFDSLKFGKTGPPTAMSYLAYVLTKKQDNAFNAEEIKAQEEAGWDLAWDPSRLWLTGLDQQGDQLRIEGEAMGHQDVTEFYRRLETSVNFFDVSPDVQELKSDLEVGSQFVAFTVNVRVNYRPEGIPRSVVESKPQDRRRR